MAAERHEAKKAHKEEHSHYVEENENSDVLDDAYETVTVSHVSSRVYDRFEGY